MPTQPSFSERIEQLEEAAKSVDHVAAIIMAEVDCMAAAAKRFSEHRGQKTERRAR